MDNAWWQDKLLISRFNQGDKDVLRRIYARYRVDMVTLAAALLFDRDQAEDVVHEVFVRLVQNRDTIRITHSLRGYLLRAVANTARNANRRERDDDPAHVAVQATMLGTAPSPAGEVLLAERCQELTAALQQLPYEQREVLLLRHYGDLKFKAIAACQGVSINTVQGRYRYGLNKLRCLLGDER